MNTNLTIEDVDYLLNLLENEIYDTKTEIHHSNNHEFKERLKIRLKFIQNLINKLSVPVNAG
jgi:hypothetical protein